MRLLAVMLLGLVTMVVHPSAAAAPAAGIGAQAVVMPADPPPPPPLAVLPWEVVNGAEVV